MARVLIVDDSGVARKCLREIVTSLGHMVVGEAPNGSQAFVEYSKFKPDVVTMDLTMQGLGGAQATSKIVAAYPEAKIIVISAMEERRVVIDALERGARHFIIKPITKDKVASVIDNVLHQDFDLKKHLERVRKMKGTDESTTTVGNNENQFLWPYMICAQGGNLVHVAINQTISLTSCQSLFLELGEHLTAKTRVLLDFGKMLSLDQALLIKLNELVQTIEGNDGMVKAVSANKKFVESIVNREMSEMPNSLANVLRYFET